MKIQGGPFPLLLFLEEERALQQLGGKLGSKVVAEEETVQTAQERVLF